MHICLISVSTSKTQYRYGCNFHDEKSHGGDGMSERQEHLKATPNGDKLTIEMDREGFEVLSRFYKGDPAARARVWGLLFAGAVQMGWVKKTAARKGKR
jgi:hypothetical protein